MKKDLLNVLLVMYRLRLPRKSWRPGSSVLIVTAMCFIVFPTQYVSLE